MDLLTQTGRFMMCTSIFHSISPNLQAHTVCRIHFHLISFLGSSFASCLFLFPSDFPLQPAEGQLLSLQHHSYRWWRATMDENLLLSADPSSPAQRAGAKGIGICSLPSSQTQDCQPRRKTILSVPSNLSAFWFLEHTCILPDITNGTAEQKQMKPMNRKLLLFESGWKKIKNVIHCSLLFLINTAYFVSHNFCNFFFFFCKQMCKNICWENDLLWNTTWSTTSCSGFMLQLCYYKSSFIWDV